MLGLLYRHTILWAALLLGGCSALKLSYNNLDWLVEWRLGRYVDLQPPQKELFDRGFRDLWSWHRGTQLKLYAGDLRELAQAAERPLSPQQVETYLALATEHAARALREAVPDTARILQTFSDAQVAELLESLAKRRRKQAEEEKDLDAQDLIERAEEQMNKNLKRWLGPLGKEQKRRVAEWARSRQYADGIWHQYQEAWAEAFTAVLAHRAEPDFPVHLGELFREAKVPYGETMARMQAHNRRLFIELMSQLSRTLSAEQRRHLQGKLRELADDLEELAAQKPPGQVQAARGAGIG
jgi:hypothetical protein